VSRAIDPSIRGGSKCFELAPVSVPLAAPIRLWRLDYDLTAEVDAATLATLTPDEERRARRFLRREDQVRSAATRAALRELLAAELGAPPRDLVIETNAYDKPFIEGGASFNVSHSGAHGLVAVGAVAEIGVDIERVQPDVDWRSLGRRVFHPTERERLEAAGPSGLAAEAYRLWVGKEAVVKALGTGFSLSPLAFEIEIRPGGSLGVSPRERDHDFPWERLDVAEVTVVPGYAAAVAVIV
jgi:4'-phosphopantetheinyl transferase